MAYFSKFVGVVAMSKYAHMPLSDTQHDDYHRTEKDFISCYTGFSSMIRDHIYRGVYDIQVQNKDFERSIIDNVPRMFNGSTDIVSGTIVAIMQKIRRCRRRELVVYHKPLTVRLYSPDGHSATIWLAADNNNAKCTDYNLTLLISEPKHLDSFFYTFIVDLNGKSYMDSMKYLIDTCIVHCKEQEATDKRFDRIHLQAVKGEITSQMVYLIDKALALCIDQYDRYGESKILFPVYTEAELDLFNSEIEIQGISQLTHPLLTTVRKGLTPDDIMDSNEQFEDLIKFPKDTASWPIVKLSQKEWKFIDKWIDDNMDHDAPLNLVTYMDSPRYGRCIKFPYKAKDGKEVTFEVMYQLSESLRLVCHEIINDNCRIVNYFDIEDPMHFKDITSNLLACIRYITTRSLNDSPIGNESLYRDTLSLNLELDDLCGILTSIIKVFIILHHRPERTRVVNYSEKRTVYRNKNNKKSAYQKDVTVWRMLAPIKEAKEYVARMSTGARRDAVYTLEEWERRGHYRTLKSGKVIWINETHCKRKLPISENREINIKL